MSLLTYLLTTGQDNNSVWLVTSAKHCVVRQQVNFEKSVSRLRVHITSRPIYCLIPQMKDGRNVWSRTEWC